MSESISVPIPSMPSNIQLTPDVQAFFEHILDQKLKERDTYYHQQLQARQEEVEARRVQREQEFQADLAARDATLESVSRQLEESRINQLWVLFNHYCCSLFNIRCRNAMDQDILPIHQPTLSTESLIPLPSNSPSRSFSKKPDAPIPTSQPRRRSPTRKASSLIIPVKPKPPRKPRKQHQPANIRETSLQPTEPESATPGQSAKEPKKPAMHVHRMLRAEVPEDATGVQVG